MSYLVRTGNGINDVTWKSSVTYGDRIFLSNQTWLTIPTGGGKWDCLQRTGNNINDIKYGALTVKSLAETRAESYYNLAKNPSSWDVVTSYERKHVSMAGCAPGKIFYTMFGYPVTVTLNKNIVIIDVPAAYHKVQSVRYLETLGWLLTPHDLSNTICTLRYNIGGGGHEKIVSSSVPNSTGMEESNILYGYNFGTPTLNNGINNYYPMKIQIQFN